MLSRGIDRRERVAVCERGKLIAPCERECISDDDKCVGPPLGEGGEGRVDFGCGTGIDNMELLPERACRFAELSQSVGDRKSTRLNSSHLGISYAVFCLKKTNKKTVLR